MSRSRLLLRIIPTRRSWSRSMWIVVESVDYDIQSAAEALAGATHLVVTLIRLVMRLIQACPVISESPKLLSLMPPNENGSRGTGTPIFTPNIPAEKR